MGVSIIDTQREIILDTIRNTARGEWKVLVVDETSKKLIDNVMKEDDILNENITSREMENLDCFTAPDSLPDIEQIEHRRPMNKDMDAVYFLSPQPYIVDCLMADFERRRYRGAFLIWTSLPHPSLRERIDRSSTAREQIRLFKVLNIEYYPRESHLVTFRDPWSFPILFHPSCNNLVRQHLEELAQKIVSVCVSLGEYPTIRYFRPPNPSHEASVLCLHLARFVQEQIDMYAQYHENFPPASNRPRGALYITDRTMDMHVPFLHEFTYQAMAHDLLQIKDGDKVTYKTVVNEGKPDQEEKDMEIGEKDKIWVENRHQHMKDTIDKIMGDFQKFINDNPHFTDSSGGNASSLNAIKDMLAGLPEFQEMKEAYSLHLTMAQECMNIFQQNKLLDLASIEQTLATGLDEDFRKPKNLADQMVRYLDDENVTPGDRLRLITLFLIYKDGLIPSDLMKLLAHAQLPPQDGEVLNNLDLLGVRVAKSLKDTQPPRTPLFARKQSTGLQQEEYSLSRFIEALKSMLEAHVSGTLDQAIFPYTKPQLEANDLSIQDNASAASLRSAKPTWAKNRLNSVEPRQRVIVFMAGGATFSESRVCYEVSAATSRDVFLVTSHMLNPGLFMRQLGDLSVDKRRLGIPAEQPPKKAPTHLFEREPIPQANAGGKMPTGLPQGPAPPSSAMGKMTISSSVPDARSHKNGPGHAHTASTASSSSSKPSKESEKKKKKHHFFSSK